MIISKVGDAIFTLQLMILTILRRPRFKIISLGGFTVHLNIHS